MIVPQPHANEDDAWHPNMDDDEDGDPPGGDLNPPAPSPPGRRQSAARRRLALEDDNHDVQEDTLGNGDDDDGGHNRRAPPRRGTAAAGPRSLVRIEDEVAQDWPFVGHRAASDLRSRWGAVAVVTVDASARQAVREIEGIPPMKFIAATMDAIGMISENKRLYLCGTAAGAMPQLFAPFSSRTVRRILHLSSGQFSQSVCFRLFLQCNSVHMSEASTLIGVVFEDGSAAVWEEPLGVRTFRLPDDERISSLAVFSASRAALLSSTGDVYLVGPSASSIGLEEDDVNAAEGEGKWVPRRVLSLSEIVSVRNLRALQVCFFRAFLTRLFQDFCVWKTRFGTFATGKGVLFRCQRGGPVRTWRRRRSVCRCTTANPLFELNRPR